MSALPKAKATLDPIELIHAVIEDGQAQVCQDEGFMAQEEMQSAAVIKKDPEVYFQNPATAILRPSELGTKKDSDSLIFHKEFNSSKQKPALIEDMKNTLSNLTKSSSLIIEILALSDELITNAIYNAPYVDPISHHHTKVDRATSVELAKDKFARVFMAEDGQRLVVGVEDPFGSLNVKTYLQRTQQCYLKGLKDSINFGPGGAGIGSFIIFNTGSSLYLGVKPGSSTIIACVIPYKMSGRRREQMPKHLHWIQVK
jgi:hypothetical protein